MARFGVNESVASLGLALYVLGCTWNPEWRWLLPTSDESTDGTGPLIWAPMSKYNLCHYPHCGTKVVKLTDPRRRNPSFRQEFALHCYVRNLRDTVSADSTRQ